LSAGSGPYILKSFVPDSEVILVKNKNYRSNIPGADRIHLRSMPDGNSQLLAIQKGDIDIAFNINSEHAKQLEGKARVRSLCV
jgi:peptide/nickel transport system substrate-binding protein